MWQAIRVGPQRRRPDADHGSSDSSFCHLPNEVRDPIGDVVLDELIERVLAGETLRPNDFEPKFSDTIMANVFQLTS
jgi:hypothetical protein